MKIASYIQHGNRNSKLMHKCRQVYLHKGTARLKQNRLTQEHGKCEKEVI